MNFIDRAFEMKLLGDDFLQAMSEYLDEPKWESIVERYPAFVKDVILIIDYDYTRQMEGMDEIINGSLADKFDEVISALEHCEIDDEAEVLKSAKRLSDIDPDEYEEQWETIEKKLAYYNDYESFWDSVRTYIDNSIANS